MTTELAGWLRAQIAEDERLARAAIEVYLDPQGPVVHVGDLLPDIRQYVAAWVPARVLAEVEAKRQILAEHQHGPATCHDGFGCNICAENDRLIEPDGWCKTVRLLALPYADRPGYQEEWKPT